MKRKYIIGFIIGLIVCPIVINIMMLIPCKWTSGDNVWIGFWGAYLGAIISAGAAFAILYIQRKDNHSENENNRIANENENTRNRELLSKEIQNRQDNAWLVELRKAILDNLSVCLPGNVDSFIDKLLQYDYSQRDDEQLQSRTKDLYCQIVQADTLVGMVVALHMTDNILKYNEKRKDFVRSFYDKINDLQMISVVVFCLNNDRTYKRQLIENCKSKELREILNNGKYDEIYGKLEVFLKKMRAEFYSSYDEFLQTSINCIATEYQRINHELISVEN